MMKLRISQRDKVLLYLLVMVLIVFVGLRYFISPAKAELKTLRETEIATKLEYDITQLTVAQISRLETSKIDYAQRLDALRAAMYAPIREGENIEWMADRLIQGAGLTCKSMTIAPTHSEDVRPYGQGQSTVHIKNIARIDMTLKGSLYGQMLFIESVRNDPYITASSFTLVDSVDGPEMNVVLELLMY